MEAIMSKRMIIAVAIATLYLVTWIGGWISHSGELASRARRYWNQAAAKEREMDQLAVTQGLPRPSSSVPYVNKRGPASRVEWCVPLLPGVLLTDSWYVVGPLYGKGGVKLVLFYGVNSAEFVTLWGWIS
jgi:hypothetical protein